jgi:hypothetical protein
MAGIHTGEIALQFSMPSAEKLKARECVSDPNAWFAAKYPEQTEKFGPAFLEARYEDVDGLKRFIPVELNTDFFAAILGGDRSLGHQVVWYEPEATFYFLDYRVAAFCPTTPAKLELLLSNFLIRCSQEMGGLVDIRPLVTTFRKAEVFESIVKKAKALLAADVTFFQGEQGHRRLVEGRIIEPTAKPSYEIFVEKNLIREDRATLTVTDAFHRYYAFCKTHQMLPLSRQEFKSLITEVVREQFSLGLRHDVPGSTGKQVEGWIGLNCRLQNQAAHGLS